MAHEEIDFHGLGTRAFLCDPEVNLHTTAKNFSMMKLAVWTGKDLDTVRKMHDLNPTDVEPDLLRVACICGAAPGVVAFLLELLPDAAKTPDDKGIYPLQHALKNSSLTEMHHEDLMALVEAYPVCLTVEMLRHMDSRALNIACICGAAPGVIPFLAQKFPHAANEPDKEGFYPLHHAMRYGPSPGRPTRNDIMSLVQACPECLTVEGNSKKWALSPLALCLHWKYDRDLIEFMFSSIPKSITSLKFPKNLCDRFHDYDLRQFRPYLRNKVDMDCIVGLRIALTHHGHITDLVMPSTSMFSWQLQAWLEFSALVLESKTLRIGETIIVRGEMTIPDLQQSALVRLRMMDIDNDDIPPAWLLQMPCLAELSIETVSLYDGLLNIIEQLLLRGSLEKLEIESYYADDDNLLPLLEIIRKTTHPLGFNYRVLRSTEQEDLQREEACIALHREKMVNLVKERTNITEMTFVDTGGDNLFSDDEFTTIKHLTTLNRCGRGIARDPEADLSNFVKYLKLVEEDKEAQGDNNAITDIRYELLHELPVKWTAHVF